MSLDRTICCCGCEFDGACDLQSSELADTCYMFCESERICLDRSQQYDYARTLE